MLFLIYRTTTLTDLERPLTLSRSSDYLTTSISETAEDTVIVPEDCE